MERRLQRFVMADSEKCVGCRACEIACFTEHNQRKNHVGKTVGTVTVPVVPKLFLTRTEGICMPIQCRHCEDAPCMEACTLHAIERVQGQIMVNQKKCTGCKDCLMACPFGSIEILPSIMDGDVEMQNDTGEIRKVASKCDYCMDNPKGPACVRACKQKALRMVELQDENETKQAKAAQILATIKD